MTVSRRDFLIAAAGTYFGTFLCSDSAFAQFPKKRTDLPKIDTERTGNWSYTGCSLRSSAEVNSAIGTNGIGNSTGIPALDAGLNRELSLMMPYFDVNVAVFTYPENNAFATMERIGNHPFRDGTVVLGIALVKELFRKFQGTSQISAGDHALVGVLAHEIAHIAYFKSRSPRPNYVKPTELHADFLAGWYTGIRAVQLPGQVNLQETSKQMYDIGDTDFNNPQHHGTSQERLSAYVAGVNLSVNSGARVTFPQAFQQANRFVGLMAQGYNESRWWSGDLT